jgi:hypothetical protein
MPRGRRARRAPSLAEDPLHKYSRWDKAIAKTFYFAIIVCTIFIVIGIWVYIIKEMIEQGLFQELLNLHIGYIIGIITGIVTGHVLLIVLFYAAFKGGLLSLCRALFKDREVAKKYEDFAVLRWLIGVLILGAAISIFFILLGFVPELANAIKEGILFLFGHKVVWRWIVNIGVFGFIWIIIIFLVFVFWNHGVYFIVKHIKQIEEEEEVEERIRRERLKDMSEKELRKAYKKETGKKAMYKGKETKGYMQWKKNNLG